MTVIKVWFLGSFQVEVDGNCIPVVDWRSKKALTLFKYLSSHPGKKIPRDRLIELLWSISDPESSIHNLHTTVYNLRRSLFPKGKKGNNHSVISYCNGLYWFDPPDGFYTDVFDFQSMTKTGYELDCVDPDEALSVYLQTLAIYRGELLVERRRDFNQAIQVCRNALNYDSTREKLHQAIIRYLLDQGRNVDAILQFKECVKILEDEVGLEPSEETCMLIQRLKNAANSGAETGNTARITDRFSVQRALKKGGELLLLFVTAPRHLEENKVLNYLANSLRQGDLICKWDQNHIGIYLNATDSVGVKVVSKRLEQGLHSEFADCKLVVRCVDSSQKNYTLMPTKALGWMGSD